MLKNRIKDHLERLGFEDARPSDDLLKKLGITIHRWNKWLRDGGADITPAQAMVLMDYLQVEHMEDLFVKKDRLKLIQRHKLKRVAP